MERDSGGVMLADGSNPQNGRFTFAQNGVDDSIEFQNSERSGRNSTVRVRGTVAPRLGSRCGVAAEG